MSSFDSTKPCERQVAFDSTVYTLGGRVAIGEVFLEWNSHSQHSLDVLDIFLLY